MAERARKRVQTWPMKVVNQATIIRSQNELLLLDLLLAYKELKRGDSDRLKGCLPELKRLIGVIYQAAKEVDDTFPSEHGGQPVWFDVSLRIKRKYPDTRATLAGIGQKLESSSKPSGYLLKEILKDLIRILNIVMDIQVDILRIPIPEQPATSGEESTGEPAAPEPIEEPTILDINSLKLIRNSGEFKFPDS